MAKSSKKSKSSGKGKGPNKGFAQKYTYVIIIVVIIAVASAVLVIYSVHTDPKLLGFAKVSTVGASTYSTSTTSQSGTNTGDSGLTYAIIHTTQGTMEVELFSNISSISTTVNNFVNLAKSGFYNNLVWHRIVQGFVIQTGDPTSRNGGGSPCSWGTGGSSQTIPLQIDPNLHNWEGYLGMARSSAPNSATSQFYINLANNSASLDGSYAVFGKVISGMSVALAIGNLPVTNCSAGGTPPQNPSDAMVTSITIQDSP